MPVDPADPGTEAITGPGGAYTATNLLPGSYLVFFGDPACFYGPYDQASQCLRDRHSAVRRG